VPRLSKIIISYLCLLILTITTGNGSHFMGGQITYKCVGGNEYVLTLKLYRDCNGCDPQVVSCQGFTDSLTGQVHTYLRVSPMLPGGVRKISMPLQSITDVTPKCKSSIESKCENPASSYPWGIQEYVFQQTVTLLPSGGPYTFTHRAEARNAAISTILDPAYAYWYIHALLDPSANCNSSPEFLNLPTAHICKDEAYAYNHNAYDADGDSLVYSLVPCMQSKFITVVYDPPYNAAYPLSSSSAFSINSATGEITFTPNLIQIGILSIMVEEYRSGVKIGEVIRDLQLTVTDCDNNVPNVRPLANSGAKDTTIYAGGSICIPFKATDQDFTDPEKNVISLSVTSGIIPPATWNNPSPQSISNTGEFCWKPSCEYIRAQPYIITVLAEDNACPLPGQSVSTFEIFVKNPTPLPPILNCVSIVNDNDDIRLQWNAADDTGVVSKYFIYRSTNATSSYKLIDSVAKTFLSYTDSDINLKPTDSTYYYYLTSGALCDNLESISTDTVSSILLNSSFLSPILTLDWNSQYTPYVPTYRIKRYNGSFYYLHDTTTASIYPDSITSCTPKYLDHKIEVIHPFGNCTSTSNTVNDTVPGRDFPSPPTICKAEVNIDNSVTLYYYSDTPLISVYYIYRHNISSGKFDLIDSIISNTTLSYVDQNVDGSKMSLMYKVTVKDTCDLYSLQSNFHRTINCEGYPTQMSGVITESENL